MPSRATATISAILVDDEQLASEELAYLLREFPDVEIVATASNGLEAVQLIEDLEPDLVFLDVQMLDGEEHWLEVRAGKLVRADVTAEPDLTFTGQAAALFAVNRGGELEADLEVTGSRAARDLFLRCFPPSNAQVTVPS